MYTKFKILGVIFLLFASHLTQAQKSEEKLVKTSFDNYKSAILNDKGEEAVKYVDSRTVKYYGDILDLVKTADSTQIESLSILDKLMVFSVRHRASKEDILRFDATSLIVYAIKSGMVGKNSVSNNAVGEVSIDNNFAKAQFLSRGKLTPYFFHFYKEEGLWKIDLTSLFPISTKAFQKMADDSGQEENEYLFYLLETLTGRQPGKEIWNPVQ
jgi:hypothetical protein